MKHARLTAIAVTAVCALGAIVFAQSTPAFQPPRTPDGKPDFTGIYQWPTYLPGQERGRSAATVFDRKYFAPLKPGGENFIEPLTDGHVLGDAPQYIQVSVAVDRSQRHGPPRCFHAGISNIARGLIPRHSVAPHDPSRRLAYQALRPYLKR